MTQQAEGSSTLNADPMMSGAPSLPSGWPSFVNSGRAQPHDNLAGSTLSRGGLFENEALISQLADAGMTQLPSPQLRRPETPILAYVDRASMPGFVDCDEMESRYKEMNRDSEAKETPSKVAQPTLQSSSLDEWEAELLEWKRRYGCPDVEAQETSELTTDSGFPQLVADPPLAEDLTSRQGEVQQGIILMSTATDKPDLSMPNTGDGKADFRAPVLNPMADLPEPSRLQSPLQPQATAAILQDALAGAPGAALRKQAALEDAKREMQQSHSDSIAALVEAQEQGQGLRDELGSLRESAGKAEDALVPASPSSWEVTAQPLVPKPPSAPSEHTGSRPAGRYLEYTAEDLELAAEKSKARVQGDGSWKSEFSETALQKRDFFADIRKQRERDKGRQVSGPLWIHLATHAKNLACSFNLAELLEALKLFASVRFDDYELYMRLLGEVPHYVTQAACSQLSDLIRILARRRLRERNYVDMVAARILHKIRATDDVLPPRQLVKTANAFAFLECRSNPKFVEHFLRHFEHRIGELDGTMCCLVSPLFVDQYMNDSLRRAYLSRCAETSAGFQCDLEEARNIACTELILRKEHHSLVVSLPPHVARYLDKVQRHAQFDKWGAVTMPVSVAPDGPKGRERAEMNKSLQLKASTAASAAGRQADVFSSDMHRDISACLTHLGVDHENGVLAGPYLLDIVAQDMVTLSKRIVYEINSPHHYYEGTQQLTADKRLRHRMIARLGHKLHHVNADEWNKLSAAQKMTHMLKLQQAQQDENAKEEKQKQAAYTSRAPLPILPVGQTKGSDSLKLKSIGDLRAPIRVPVPPSQRARQAMSAR